jgi:hypothetical protein
MADSMNTSERFELAKKLKRYVRQMAAQQEQDYRGYAESYWGTIIDDFAARGTAAFHKDVHKLDLFWDLVGDYFG